MTDYRDAVTGEYVTQEYALANPSTTVAEAEPDGTIEEAPTTTQGVLREEIVMANEKADQRSEQAQEQQARREAEAAERQAQKDAREAERQAHPDQTLPEDLQ